MLSLCFWSLRGLQLADELLAQHVLRRGTTWAGHLDTKCFRSNCHSDFTLFLCAFEANHPDCSSMFKSSLSAFDFLEFTKWHRMTANDVVGAVCTFEIFSWAAGAEVWLASSYCWGRSETCCKRFGMICCVLFENKQASTTIDTSYPHKAVAEVSRIGNV